MTHMRTSEKCEEFFKAFLAAQREMGHPARKSKNPHLRNEFADLPTVIDEVKPVLNKHGIAFIQTVGGAGIDAIAIGTRLVHGESGQWVESTIERSIHEQKGLTLDQVIGSMSTYMRRYQLSAMAGVASEPDNDGNESNGHGEPAAKAAPKQRVMKPTGSPVTVARANKRSEPSPEPDRMTPPYAPPEPDEPPEPEGLPDVATMRRAFYATIRGNGLFPNDDARKVWCQKFSGVDSTAKWNAQTFINAIQAIEDIKAQRELADKLERDA